MESNAASTSKTIYDMLKEEILNLTIKPGQQLTESEVCNRFQVSRTPVRTAFQRLKDAGLLQIVPYKSTCATLLDFDQIGQLIYMRIAVETMVLRDFLEQADALTIEKIRYNLKRQEILISDGCGPDAFYEADSRLHNIWFTSTHKELLWRSIQKAQINYTRFRMLDIVDARHCRDIYEEHLQLFEIIQGRRQDQIEAFCRRHLNGGINRLGERIYTEFADYFVKKDTQ